MVNLGRLLAKSSNVGAVQVSFKLDKEMLWSTLGHFGVGKLTASRFPGESAGILPPSSLGGHSVRPPWLSVTAFP